MAGNTLIASVGGAPQVVTETLWALMNPEQLLDEALRGRAPFIPNLVYLAIDEHQRTDELFCQERLGVI